MTVPSGLIQEPIYLDHNATTPVDPRVVEASMPYLAEHFGNPSSVHTYGQRTRIAVEAARAAVGEMIGAAAEDIVSSLSVFQPVSRGWPDGAVVLAGAGWDGDCLLWTGRDVCDGWGS